MTKIAYIVLLMFTLGFGADFNTSKAENQQNKVHLNGGFVVSIVPSTPKNNVVIANDEQMQKQASVIAKILRRQKH